MATNKAGSSFYSYTVAPHLAEEFDVPISDFAIAHPQHTHYVLGAFIFTHRLPASSASRLAKEEHLSKPTSKPESQPLMLIIQRAITDSWGGYWDFPGGSLEPTDQTLLDGVAREVFEETGFHVRKIRELVRVDAWTVHKRGVNHRVAKFTFVVDVHESVDTPEWEEKVRLSPAEHMKWLWVTEEEIRESARVMREVREGNPGRIVEETAPYAFVGIQGETAWEGFKTYLRLLGREVGRAGDDAAKV
ncbi:hypothetical protein UA08_05214 [Talaromyces atroroseus]|uniref:Nudix hydrolase domain-containing protein n=1 Tax=Talaromyces atroroseus TaxID=1441469 RepID=A0A225B1C1_TALAT|nr:hypothetical protein UA08_05214 [Talaromyces atroroseus]OKL59607.1 hypothetical protein UA08_05214 [Talaromyces atroroseus]